MSVSSRFLNTRGALARLLATENLVVEHSPEATTASFDVDNRVLRLPVLKVNDEHVYNLFVAHEVGHALQTPADMIKNHSDIPFDIINIVEDVRIEKFIQNKFPGLRVDFSKGYRQMKKDDFFKIADKNISTMNFLDRLNLHFKLGNLEYIPFSPDELPYVSMVNECETPEDVIEISRQIYKFLNLKKEEENVSPPPSDSEDSKDSDDSNSSSPPSDSKDSDDSNSSEDKKSNQIESDDSEDSKDSDNSNSSSPPSSESSPQQETGENSSDTPSSFISETQRNMDESMKDLVENNFYANDIVYLSPPKIDNIKNYIISLKTIRDNFNVIDQHHLVDDAESEFSDFLRGVKPDVNLLVQQFEMKKSADEYKRQQINKTGILNTNLLHNYKLVDDIFARQTIIPEGKNHGIIFLVDFSGSMQNSMHNVIKQLLMIVLFCQRVNIPYRVYSFTSQPTESASKLSYKDFESDKKNIDLSSVRLCEILSSSEKKKVQHKDMYNLYHWSKTTEKDYRSASYMSTYYRHYFMLNSYLQLAGTPLNNALFFVPKILNEFQKETKTQKISFVALTDGDSAPLMSFCKNKVQTHYSDIMLRENNGKVTFLGKGTYFEMTGNIVNWLRGNFPDVTFTNIFIGNQSSSRHHFRKYDVSHKFDDKLFKTKGSVSVKTDRSWSMISVVNPNCFDVNQEEMKLSPDMSKAKLRTNFRKFITKKQNSRLLMSTLADQFT